MMIPKPLSPEAVKARDAVEALAGRETCKPCGGTGRGPTYTKEFMPGKVYHCATVCSYCEGARYVEKDEDNIPF